MYTVYVLKSTSHNFHYIGHTSDITKRHKTHNSGKVRSTKAYRTFTIIYTEEFNDKSSAFKREMYLKSAEGNAWLRTKLKRDNVW
ncbi:GIY-YIG nuclease family protein [bacterium]|nr:GIY-YIG nuclease family protein [bacterium]MBU1065066.1 GIY-YIG nuclease family protein [bacterium]MBU1634644.1 GIY-YIG nuclease family protein [bacterium]MBU1874671.1 GIY-YIG nuclease family protein [bacterium]